MIKIQGESNSRFSDGQSRCDFLQIGPLTMGGMALPQALHAEEELGGAAGAGVTLDN